MSTPPTRHLQNDLEPFDFDNDLLAEHRRAALAASLRSAIDGALEFIDREHETNANERFGSATMFKGTGGIVYALLRLVDQRSSLGLSVMASQRTDVMLRKYATACLRPAVVNAAHCGDSIGIISGQAAAPLVAILLHLRRLVPLSTEEQSSHIQALRNLNTAFSIPSGAVEADTGFDAELFKGRSGFLYALLLLSKELRTCDSEFELIADQLTPLVCSESLSAKLDMIISSGRAGAAATPQDLSDVKVFPLVWRWSLSPRAMYLGAAHGIYAFQYTEFYAMFIRMFTTGIGGILTVLFSVPRSVRQRHDDVLLEELDRLIELQLESGNWLSRPVAEKDDLVQWCHGAPGMVLLIARVFELWNNNELDLTRERLTSYKIAMEQGCQCIWDRGLLVKGPSLCHGIAGNAYALLHASRSLPINESTFSKDLRGKSIAMAVYAARWRQLEEDGLVIRAEASSSLMCGVAGAVCLWSDVLAMLNSSPESVKGFPMFMDA